MPRVNRFFRFRLWHMFVLVTIVAATLWLITQVGMVTGEIEVTQFDTWPRTTAVESDAPIEVINVKFKYVNPPELSNTTLNLFFGDPAYTDVKNIDIGSRIKFRYRARPILWLKTEQPDPIAIDSLGLNADDIEEIITEVDMSEN